MKRFNKFGNMEATYGRLSVRRWSPALGRWHMCLSVSPIGETDSANRSELPLDCSLRLCNCLSSCLSATEIACPD
jgi:hypothetical protein